jgi:uncharacterized delta-60 repeat protein
MAIQADGKIIVAGSARPGTTEDFGAIRFNPNGTIDTSFGNTTPAPNGKFSREITASQTDRCTSIAIQPDGKIILAGYSRIGSGNDNFAVMRLNPDGSLDTSFGSPNGYVHTDIASNEFGTTAVTDRGNAVAVQIVGGQTKIVVSGTHFTATGSDLATVRYNSDGTLDTGFGGNGIVVTSFSGSDAANAVAITPDNKVVVAGYDNNADFAVVRYNSDGTPDTVSDSDPLTHFDVDGKLTTDFGSSSDQARAVAVQSNGKIIVGGYTIGATTSSDFALVRYNTDGSLDGGFDGDGKNTTVITAGNSSDIINSLAIQPNGKIVAGGLTVVGTSTDYAMTRYNGNGTLDSTFGSGGLVVTGIGTTSDEIKGVGIQADGKIVAGGYSNLSVTDAEFSLARYSSSSLSFTWDGSDSSDWHTGTNWLDGVAAAAAANADVSLPASGVANETIISASDVTVNNLSVGANRTINISNNRTLTVNGTLTMGGGNITVSSGGKLVIGSSGAISRSSGRVIGTVQKNFTASGSFTFPVGTLAGYTPVVVAGTTGSGSFTVTSNDGFLSGANTAQSIQRNWTLESAGITSANITLTYLDSDIPAGASEAGFKFIRHDGIGVTSFNPTSFNAATNTFTLNGVNSFSDWSLGNLAPTAASVSVSGRVSSAKGIGISRASVSITDSLGNVRVVKTNSFGYFRFDEIEAGQTYVFNVSAKGYSFAPQLVNVSEDIADLNLTPQN